MSSVSLICFHSAGASGSMFTSLKKKHNAMVKYCEVNKIKLVCPNVSDVIDVVDAQSFDFLQVVRKLYDKYKILFNESNYVLAGHSMGSMIIHELLRLININNDNKPVKIILSATVSPLIEPYNRPWKILNEASTNDELKAHLRSWGIQEEILTDKYFKIFGPMLRRDFISVGRYKSVGAVDANGIEILGIVGNKDPFISEKHMMELNSCYLNNKKFIVKSIDGDHNLLIDTKSREQWFELIINELESLLVHKINEKYGESSLEDEINCF